MTAMITGAELAYVLQLTYADDEDTFDQVASAADHVLGSLLVTGDHSTHEWCKEAALAVGTEMFQARTAVGGQPMALDYNPGAYRLSVWLTRRVQGVVGSCWAVTGMVG